MGFTVGKTQQVTEIDQEITSELNLYVKAPIESENTLEEPTYTLTVSEA